MRMGPWPRAQCFEVVASTCCQEDKLVPAAEFEALEAALEPKRDWQDVIGMWCGVVGTLGTLGRLALSARCLCAWVPAGHASLERSSKHGWPITQSRSTEAP